MPRPATGSIVERRGVDGRVYRSLRFRALGQRRTMPLGPVSRVDAERELAFVMADVERGRWLPPNTIETPAEPEIPTFHSFAERWWLLHERTWRPKTVNDYRWKLEAHLIPFFGELRLNRITVAEVEQYAATKLAEEPRPLSPRSINASITLLAQILEAAVDRDLMTRNPARGRGRKIRERPPVRSYLETAGQISALLEAAAELDREARVDRRHVEREAILATFIFAGVRIGELCALRWRDVDLAAGWITIGDAKTPAGRRRVKIRGRLASLLAHVRDRQTMLDQDTYVFATTAGRCPSGANIRNRVLAGAICRANQNLDVAGEPPLPSGLTPHSLRRTFCSLLYALGVDPGTVMDEMGHSDPGLALRVYRQAMRRDGVEISRLRAVVEIGCSHHALSARR
ncbi:MAG TPA: site-specific integrase [Solirubrobacteraceae bacterium]|jgi:integrase|nr:site-specific integrase [Solirubrobacteraceae bacterium]